METFPRKTQERQQLKANDDDDDAQYLCEEEKRESEERESERERASRRARDTPKREGDVAVPLGVRHPFLGGDAAGPGGWDPPRGDQNKTKQKRCTTIAPLFSKFAQIDSLSFFSLFFSPPFFLLINQSGASVVATYPYFWGMKCGSSWMKVGHN
jgi:hypothetical protein